MAEFTEEVVKLKFTTVRGQCECAGCSNHNGRCVSIFQYGDRATSGDGNWHADYRVAEKNGGKAVLANCRIMCSPCHTKAASHPEPSQTY